MIAHSSIFLNSKRGGKAVLAECLLCRRIWAELVIVGLGEKIKISDCMRVIEAIWVHRRFPSILGRFKSQLRRSVGREKRCAPLRECPHTSSR